MTVATNGNGNGTATRRGRKSTKTLADVKAQVISDQSLDPVSREANKARKVKIQKETVDQTLEKALTAITTVRLATNKSLDAIVGEVQQRFDAMSAIEEAINLKRQELDELHGKDVVLSETAELIARHELASKELSQKQTEARMLWDREQADHARAIAERDSDLAKSRKRENDDYNYNLSLTRKKDQDDYAEEQRKRTAAMRQREEELNRNWQEREQTMLKAEAELAKQKADIEASLVALKSEMDKDKAIALNSLKRDYEDKIKTRELEFQNQRQALELQFKHAQQSITENTSTITQLREQLAAAQKQAQELALKTIEAQSGAKSLEAVKDFAQSSGPAPKRS